MTGLRPAEQRKLTGTEFEQIVDSRCKKYHENREAHVKRYGVQAVRNKEEWKIIQSKPDFEGVIFGGYQFVFDCKVVSGASFSLDKYRDDVKAARHRQLNHMFDRSQYGVKCFFLIHWNARKLATKAEPAITWAFPVHPRMPFWIDFLSGEARSITRRHCEKFGRHIPWTLYGERDRIMQPDVLAAL